MALNTFIVSSVGLLITLYASQYREEDLKKTLAELKEDLGLPRIKTYDVVIVGGGTAGCVLAARLTEHLSVLLIEKGGPPPPLVDNPLDFNEVVSHPDINDVWSSVPQTHIRGESGGINTVTSGRMLGGSGSHNANFYNRGSPADYDSYAKLFNDSSWSFSSTLQYFRRIENFVGPLTQELDRETFYGSGGPIHVESRNPAIMPLWFQAGRELGYETCDPQTQNGECFTYIMKSTHNGVRSSSYNGYVEPVLKTEGRRPNLSVLLYSDVEQVLIDETTKEAYGVTYRRHGVAQIAHAQRQIVLSAGTFGSPMILMKSGLGPGAVLQKAKIPLVSYVPGVGRNLRTHAVLGLDFIVRNTSEDYFPSVAETEIEKELSFFHNEWRSGLFTQNTVAQAQALLVSGHAKTNGEPHHPDIRLRFDQIPLIGNNKGPQKLKIIVGANRLLSVGEVVFNHTAFIRGERDPIKLSIVDYKMLEHSRDREVLLEGMKIAIRIVENTKAFRQFDITFDMKGAPKACSHKTPKSDGYWKCLIRQRGGTPRGHQVGTCKMGVLATDKMAVVDPKFKVRGVKKLRVVDASVFPFPINANINAAVLMIAEKAADDILLE